MIWRLVDRREIYCQTIGQVLVRIVRTNSVTMGLAGLAINYISFAMKVILEKRKDHYSFPMQLALTCSSCLSQSSVNYGPKAKLASPYAFVAVFELRMTFTLLNG